MAKEAGNREFTELVYFQPFFASAVADLDMGVMKQDLVSDHWINLFTAIINGQANDLITGLNKHGKELLMQQHPLIGTLLHAAVIASGIELLTQLVEFMIKNDLTKAVFLRNEDGNTALHNAAFNEQWCKAACLIKAAPKTVYQVNHKGISPLYLTVKGGHQDIVKLMLSESCLLSCASEILTHTNSPSIPLLLILPSKLDPLAPSKH